MSKSSTLDAPRLRRWTCEEFYRMDDLGILDDERVELVEGEVIDMGRQGSRHFYSLEAIRRVLERAFSNGYNVRAQAPLRLSSHSSPVPDVAVVRGVLSDFKEDHPRTAVLVVEVSDTTLGYDRSRKAGLYAKAGIPEYWIINLKDRQLEVRRSPRKDSLAQYGYSYGEVTVVAEDASIAPLLAPGKRVRVSSLLP